MLRPSALYFRPIEYVDIIEGLDSNTYTSWVSLASQTYFCILIINVTYACIIVFSSFHEKTHKSNVIQTLGGLVEGVCNKYIGCTMSPLVL